MNSQAGSVTQALVLAAVAVGCAISGCNERGDNAGLAETAGCSARVIVRFATEVDDALLADLERTNALDLEPLGTITTELRVYTLHAAGSNDDCVAAIDRLRRDERVQSVDIDSRRALHEE